MNNKNLALWLVLSVGLFLLSFNSALAVSGGSISGYKWYDSDQDGIWDEGEPPINNWGIDISGPISPIVTTDENGFYQWDGLPDGDYTVCEPVSENWEHT